MVRIYKRIHKILSQRVQQSKREKGKDKKSLKKYVDSTKDLYAYVRIMDVCKSLSRDVNDLKEVLDALVNKGKPN